MYGLFNRGEVFLFSPGKTIGEQYKIVEIAQAETIRQKRELLTFIERSLQMFVTKETLSLVYE